MRATADLLLLGFIAGFVRGGSSTGFLRRLVGFACIALSLVVGAYLRPPVGGIVGGIFPQIPEAHADMVGYSVAFTVLVVALNVITHPILARVPVRGVSRELDGALGALFRGIVLAVLGPLLPTDVSSLVPTTIQGPGVPGAHLPFP